MIKLKEIIQYKKIDNQTISFNNKIYEVEVGNFDESVGFYLQEEDDDDYICNIITVPARDANTHKIVKNTYIIDDIETKFDYRRKGLATFLFKYAQDYFKKQNKKLVHSPTTTVKGSKWIKSLEND